MTKNVELLIFRKVKINFRDIQVEKNFFVFCRKDFVLYEKVSIFVVYLTVYFQGMEVFDRITRRSDVMNGKACIRNMRVTVGMIIHQVGTGHSIEEILSDYPYLEREDILQAFRYAALRVE